MVCENLIGVMKIEC